MMCNLYCLVWSSTEITRRLNSTIEESESSCDKTKAYSSTPIVMFCSVKESPALLGGLAQSQC